MNTGLQFPVEFNKECTCKPIPQFAFVPRPESGRSCAFYFPSLVLHLFQFRCTEGRCYCADGCISALPRIASV